MSPALFNVYAEKLVEKALQKSINVVIGGDRIKSIVYADDRAVVEESQEVFK